MKGASARAVAGLLVVALASWSMHAAGGQQSQSADVQLQLATQLMEDGRYAEALEAYQGALTVAGPEALPLARAGFVQAALRTAQFEAARRSAAMLAEESPLHADAIALHGDALWASGLFEEAEARYDRALQLDRESARARHGVARSLAARNRLDAALTEATTALDRDPRNIDLHYTLGTIQERLRQFDAAAASFSNFVNLLPNRDRSDRADWARSEIRYLRSFGQRTPLQMDAGADEQVHTIDFRLLNDKIIVRARVNGSALQDFVVDTGAESTILSGSLARRVGVTPVTFTLSAGVGDVGIRGLQLARIDSLELGTIRIRNVPCLIKDPPLRNLPIEEAEALSPLALGFSMTIDFTTRKLTLARRLPEETADFALPLRMHRLPMVRGLIDGAHPASFVVDTGGEQISISQATAEMLGRPEPQPRIPAKVFGSSGWDPDAFLMPGVNLAFEDLRYDNFTVVVLNLHTPSALLGFQLGGIVGHRFLRNYRVSIDLDRSVLRLKRLT